ncbi:MAG: hypothetical protein EOM69_03280, partial [Clostridia bacterium]|nr:hypothetical protein [Clostridia bacterium]
MAIKLYSKQEYEKLMQQIPQAKSRTESVAQGTSSFAPIKLYAKEEFSVGQKSRKQENTARKAYETDYAKLSAMTRLAERQQENELPALEAQAGKAKEDAKRFRGRMNWLTEAQTAEHAKATRTAREASDAAEALRQELQREAWAQQAAKSRQHATDLMINVPSDARPDVGKAAQNTAGFGDFGRYMNYVISPEIKAFVDKAMPEALKRGRDYPALNSMTEFEKKALLYYAEQSEDKAREYFEAMLPEWRARAAKRDAEQETYKARENKAYGVYRNLTEAPAQMDALLESISQYAKNQTTGRNDPIDPNAPRMKGVWRTQATREGITDGMNEGAKFLTDTALSLGQYAMKLPMGQFALLALGVEAAGSKAYDVTKRGGSAGEALLAGGMAGAIEALTEKMPLDMLFKISKAGARTAKEAIWNTLKQAGVEAGEEMVSELANNVVDLRVMGDRSEMERTVRDLMENEGMTRAQAENRAFEQFFVWNTLLAGAGGALSGGVMAGAGNVVGNYQNAVELQDGRFETMMREIQESDPRQKLFPKEPQQSKTDEAFARLDEWLESRARKQETPSGGKLPQFLLDSMEAENKKAAKTAVTRSFPTQEQGSIVRQLRNALPELSKMQPVSSVTGNEIKRAGVKFIDAAMQFVENIGGKVNRPGFGDVLFSKAKVKGSFIGHGVGDAKIETFAAVPDVIARGEQVAHEKNWKGKGYDTYLFAAPIEYRGKRGILGAIVAKDKESNRYYLHEVIDQNGDIIYNMGETAEGPSDRRSGLAADLDTVAPSAVSKNNVPQEIPFVKNEPKQNNYQFPTATTNKEKGGKLPQFLL